MRGSEDRVKTVDVGNSRRCKKSNLKPSTRLVGRDVFADLSESGSYPVDGEVPEVIDVIRNEMGILAQAEGTKSAKMVGWCKEG